MISVRPDKVKFEDQILVPFSEGGSSGSGQGRAEGGDVPVPAQDQVISDDHDPDEDGAVCFDAPGEAPHLQIRVPPDVPVPSAEMVRRHKASGHCPYRPWCEHCVRGAANQPAHRRRDSAPVGNLPELHSDYGFFRDKKGDKSNTVTVLVTKDRKSKGVCAHVVPRKGVGGGFAVKQYVRDVKKFGYRHKVVIRTDGEYAIRDLVDKAANLRASETVVEHTPPGDSKANGTAERAMQTIEKQCRVLKLEMEEQAGKFGVKHSIFPWLVNHAADVLTKFQVHEDGLTSYERIKGRAYSGTMLNLGQCILYKVAPKVSGGEMGARWEKGMWLGKRFASDEHIISTSAGLVARSAAVKAHPELAFDSLLFDALLGQPWDPEGKSRVGDQDAPEGDGALPRVAVPRGLEAEIPQPRGFKISREMIERFGPTDTCRKCQALIAGDTSLSSLGHSLTCRARMTELLGADPVLARRLDNVRRREDEYIERRVAAGDTSAEAKRRRRPLGGDTEELQPGPGGYRRRAEGTTSTASRWMKMLALPDPAQPALSLA